MNRLGVEDVCCAAMRTYILIPSFYVEERILVHIYFLSTGEWRQKNHGGFLGIQFIKINELQG